MTRGLPTRGPKRNKLRPPPAPAAAASRLQQVRQERGVGVAELARRIGASRQTLYAIESGSYVPNTAIALRLARVLNAKVEDLFQLDDAAADAAPGPPAGVRASLLSPSNGGYAAGTSVRLTRVGARTVAVAATPFPAFLADADGVIAERRKGAVTVRPLTEAAPGRPQLVIAGCDPALSILARELAAAGVDVVLVSGSSRDALDWLHQGLVHVAGTHLRDLATAEYNLAAVAGLFPAGAVRIVTFAEWEQGWIVPRGNPKRIRTAADLADKKLTIMNRPEGSGARDLLDRQLHGAGVAPSKLSGYGRIAPSHLAAAASVAAGQADCCMAAVSVARSLNLGFVPLAKERFDLVVRAGESDTPALRCMFNALQRSSLRRALVTLADYDVSHTGAVVPLSQA